MKHVCLWTLDHLVGADGAWPQGCVHLVSNLWKPEEECLSGESHFKIKWYFSKSLLIFYM